MNSASTDPILVADERVEKRTAKRARKPARDPAWNHRMPRAPGVARMLYPINDAAHLLGLSRSRTYELIKDEILPTVKIGRRTLIPHAAIEHIQSGKVRIAERPPRRDPAELTADEIREIKLSTLSLTKIAEQFRISSSTARLIRAAR